MSVMDKILDARLVHGVVTREEYLEKHRHSVAVLGRVTWRAKGPLMVGIEHGRYIADCVHCKRPLSASKLWKLALCFTCGAHYDDDQICWPPPDVEHALLLRPAMAEDFFVPVNRNWRWGEPILNLWAENVEHGVG